jgi:hypothetical protein
VLQRAFLENWLWSLERCGSGLALLEAAVCQNQYEQSAFWAVDEMNRCAFTIFPGLAGAFLTSISAVGGFWNYAPVCFAVRRCLVVYYKGTRSRTQGEKVLG